MGGGQDPAHHRGEHREQHAMSQAGACCEGEFSRCASEYSKEAGGLSWGRRYRCQVSVAQWVDASGPQGASGGKQKMLLLTR